MLRRMKGFDAGHIQRSDASKPSGAVGTDQQMYGKSHAERMQAKQKQKQKQKKPLSTAKDEV